MSYNNRGVKRDSFGNRNFKGNNRQMGNMGGGGNRMDNNMSGNGGGMNPWESGMMPGRGILPTPNNNLSLNSPQAQLAIASNLLSNILRNQSDNQPQVVNIFYSFLLFIRRKQFLTFCFLLFCFFALKTPFSGR